MCEAEEGLQALLEIVKAKTGQEVMVSVTRMRGARGLSFAGKESDQ